MTDPDNEPEQLSHDWHAQQEDWHIKEDPAARVWRLERKIALQLDELRWTGKRIAELEGETAELRQKMKKLKEFDQTGDWKADIKPSLPDAPVTRRELAYVLWVLCGTDGLDGRTVKQLGLAASSLERGQDARGPIALDGEQHSSLDATLPKTYDREP